MFDFYRPPCFLAQKTQKALLSLLLLLLFPAMLGAEPKAERDTLVIFGDSLSASYGMDEEEGWVSLLRERIESEELGYRVLNGSVSGETTDGGLARLPAILRREEPDIVLLELGGNDGLRGLPVSHIRSNLEAMVKMARDAGAAVVLAGIQIPPNYGSRYTDPFYAQYGEIAEDYDLPLIPFLIEGIAENPSLMQDDGIHPRASAQEMILENVWPVLGPLLRDESQTVH